MAHNTPDTMPTQSSPPQMCTTDSPNNKFFTYSDVFKVCMCEDVIVECIPDENWETYAYNGVSFDLLGLALRARLTTPLFPPPLSFPRTQGVCPSLQG